MYVLFFIPLPTKGLGFVANTDGLLSPKPAEEVAKLGKLCMPSEFHGNMTGHMYIFFVFVNQFNMPVLMFTSISINIQVFVYT